MRKKNLPEYEIIEHIEKIKNPELDTIKKAKDNIKAIFQYKMLDDELQRNKKGVI